MQKSLPAGGCYGRCATALSGGFLAASVPAGERSQSCRTRSTPLSRRFFGFAGCSTTIWNPSGSFGWELSKAANLKHSEEPVYVWDVRLIYGPDAVWEGTSSPQPELLMHQLYFLKDSGLARLDSEQFAKKVHPLLASVPR
jgi:hypothetical protein